MSRGPSRPFAFALVTSAVLLSSAPVSAQVDDNNQLKAVPFAFVGTAEQCNPGPAGSNIITSAWLGGAGLPDSGRPNTTADDLASNADKRDPHLGLLLSKNGPTADCSAAGAEIRGASGIIVTPEFELGYDYRNGGHCGGGAPRFNVSYTLADGSSGFSFVGGCANDSTPTAAPQDPLQWSRVRFQTSDPAESFPVIPVGSRIERISLILDEGTDTPTLARPSGDLGNPAGIGASFVDNIFVNGSFIRRGQGIEPKPGERDQRD
jgi:hypothetical protein